MSADAQAKLHARLAGRFVVVDDVIPVGPLAVRLTRVADPQTVLNDICRRIDVHEKLTGQRVHGDYLGLPYWAEVWDSAIGVGQWLFDNRLDVIRTRPEDDAAGHARAFEPTRVLDLGCGMGLAGTIAALLGGDVLLADIEPDCLLFARLNAGRYSSRVRTRKLDWGRDELDEQFDLILGSDVLYEQRQWEAIEHFVSRHLAVNGRVVLGEPGRISGEQFIEWINSRPWDVHLNYQKIPTRAGPIKLFELIKQNENC